MTKKCSNFAERCYTLLKTVPAGKVTTYAELAHALGTKAYRAVGQVMNKNPYAPIVPCHRVVCSDGRIGGFAQGSKKKKELLKAEKISFTGDFIADFATRKFTFNKSKTQVKS